MSDLTDKLDAAVGAAVAKIAAAGDTAALQTKINDLQSQLDAANATIAADEADIAKQTDALNAAVAAAPQG